MSARRAAATQVVLPELRQLADYFEADEPDFPRELMLQRAKCVRSAIATIGQARTTARPTFGNGATPAPAGATARRA